MNFQLKNKFQEVQEDVLVIGVPEHPEMWKVGTHFIHTIIQIYNNG